MEIMIHKLLQGIPYPLDDNYQLSLITKADIDDLVMMLQDDEVTEYLWFAPAPEQFYWEYFAPMAEQNAMAIKGECEPLMALIIRDTHTRAFAGMAAIIPMGMIPGVYEIGYQLDRSFWGKGLATRVSRLLLRYGFEHLNAHKIVADCYASNKGSERVMQKIGMTKEGHQKDFYPYRGGLEDRIHYGISK
ncbi:GNAT family N-acetyltransferase [Endozoicomonas gorgoniicola]|uniref:GNAT family N-acetyltransferase n=1 Tax=Endozoicomonas gorgoniicola TaxID=1234144 RepID=A0ABT3MPZ7_9GAMM|nr:GNAT family N-acetyltransferase [Endozoicomonas gorgoniicola]MCW7551449.1 GNAT family N-acetyltransferase [Endozoicomonas gorgoniicola]